MQAEVFIKRAIASIMIVVLGVSLIACGKKLENEDFNFFTVNGEISQELVIDEIINLYDDEMTSKGIMKGASLQEVKEAYPEFDKAYKEIGEGSDNIGIATWTSEKGDALEIIFKDEKVYMIQIKGNIYNLRQDFTSDLINAFDSELKLTELTTVNMNSILSTEEMKILEDIFTEYTTNGEGLMSIWKEQDNIPCLDDSQQQLFNSAYQKYSDTWYEQWR